MTPNETIIKLEQAALTAQAEHRYDSAINFHGEALRQAQLALKKKYPHPLYWGAFICQGEPGPLEGMMK